MFAAFSQRQRGAGQEQGTLFSRLEDCIEAFQPSLDERRVSLKIDPSLIVASVDVNTDYNAMMLLCFHYRWCKEFRSALYLNKSISAAQRSESWYIFTCQLLLTVENTIHAAIAKMRCMPGGEASFTKEVGSLGAIGEPCPVLSAQRIARESVGSVMVNGQPLSYYFEYLPPCLRRISFPKQLKFLPLRSPNRVELPPIEPSVEAAASSLSKAERAGVPLINSVPQQAAPMLPTSGFAPMPLPFAGLSPFVQQGYPPFVQQGYPPFVQQGYPPFVRQGYPPFVQQGYPPFVQQGYPLWMNGMRQDAMPMPPTSGVSAAQLPLLLAPLTWQGVPLVVQRSYPLRMNGMPQGAVPMPDTSGIPPQFMPPAGPAGFWQGYYPPAQMPFSLNCVPPEPPPYRNHLCQQQAASRPPISSQPMTPRFDALKARAGRLDLLGATASNEPSSAASKKIKRY